VTEAASLQSASVFPTPRAPDFHPSKLKAGLPGTPAVAVEISELQRELIFVANIGVVKGVDAV